MIKIYNDPEFQALVKRAKWRKLFSLARCIYCWAFLVGPPLLLEAYAVKLTRVWAWVYLVVAVALFIFGVSLWVRGTNGLFVALHKPLCRFLKNPTEEGLRRVCAEMVAVRPGKKYPKQDYDLMRRAHTIAERNTAIISRDLFESYTTILRTCHVAGI